MGEKIKNSTKTLAVSTLLVFGVLFGLLYQPVFAQGSSGSGQLIYDSNEPFRLDKTSVRVETEAGNSYSGVYEFDYTIFGNGISGDENPPATDHDDGRPLVYVYKATFDGPDNKALRLQIESQAGADKFSAEPLTEAALVSRRLGQDKQEATLSLTDQALLGAINAATVSFQSGSDPYYYTRGPNNALGIRAGSTYDFINGTFYAIRTGLENGRVVFEPVEIQNSLNKILVDPCVNDVGQLVNDDSTTEVDIYNNLDNRFSFECENPGEGDGEESEESRRIIADLEFTNSRVEDNVDDRYQITPAYVQARNAAGEIEASAETDVTQVLTTEINLTAILSDVDPGNYSVCTNAYEGPEVCQDVIKVEDQIARVEFTGEQVNPELFELRPVDRECNQNGGALAWILCPVVTAMLEFLEDTVGEQLTELLLINNPYSSDAEPGVREIWSSFVTIANVLFAVGFMIIIFAQALSLNIDAYTIKRALPRLVVAVILTQLSLFIGGLLIDFFNVLGIGLGSLMLLPLGDNDTVTISLNVSTGGGLGGGTQNFISNLLGAGGLVFAITNVGAILFGLLAVLPGILLTVIAVVLTLIIRKVVILGFIVLAPLALASFVLPNTEKIGKEWFDNFMKVLAMFPIIVGFLALGRLAGGLITVSTTDPTIFDTIASLLANFGPYALIPLSYRFAGKAFGTIAGTLSNAQAKVNGKGGGSGGGGGKPGWQQKYKGFLNNQRNTTAAGTGRFSSMTNTGGKRGLAKGVIGATLRGSARSTRAGINPSRFSARHNEMEYLSGVHHEAQEMAKLDPALAQSDGDLRRVMEGGTYKGRKPSPTQRLAAAELLAGTHGKLTAEDMEGLADIAGTTDEAKTRMLNQLGYANKGAGNLGASTFRVQNGQVINTSASKVHEAGAAELARDKHLGRGEDTYNALMDNLNYTTSRSDYSTDDEYQQAVQVSENRRQVTAQKAVQAMGYAGGKNETQLRQVLADAGFSSQQVEDMQRRFGAPSMGSDGDLTPGTGSPAPRTNTQQPVSTSPPPTASGAPSGASSAPFSAGTPPPGATTLPIAKPEPDGIIKHGDPDWKNPSSKDLPK